MPRYWDCMKELVPKIIELGRLCLQFGRVNRVTYHEDGERLETDTDHTVMLGIMGCAFAERYAPHLDRGLVAQFAFVHDFVEVYAGDTNTMNITAERQAAKAAREAEALAKLRALFAGVLPWLHETIEQYDSLSTPEARFVKSLDKVLPKVTHILNRGAALREHGIEPSAIDPVNSKQLVKIRASYGADQPKVLELYQAIHEELCRVLHEPAPQRETFFVRMQDGRTFRCDNVEGDHGPCRSNCFHKPFPEDENLYACNACGCRYRGEK